MTPEDLLLQRLAAYQGNGERKSGNGWNIWMTTSIGIVVVDVKLLTSHTRRSDNEADDESREAAPSHD